MGESELNAFKKQIVSGIITMVFAGITANLGMYVQFARMSEKMLSQNEKIEKLEQQHKYDIARLENECKDLGDKVYTIKFRR